jgi:type IV secretory pathway VirB10-like protein
MEIALATIAVQTTILTALWFRQWKKEKIGQKKEQIEWKQTDRKETGTEKELRQPSTAQTTEKDWSELQRELERVKEKETAPPAEEEEKSVDEGDWEEFAK